MAHHQILLNGETREIPPETNLDTLLELFFLPKQRVAIELNNQVVSRQNWPVTIVQGDDKVEVVHFVGGG
ncbi:MAG: sulfur carrier protein ThiS [Pyrinomonadaceae bacterium]